MSTHKERCVYVFKKSNMYFFVIIKIKRRHHLLAAPDVIIKPFEELRCTCSTSNSSFLCLKDILEFAPLYANHSHQARYVCRGIRYSVSFGWSFGQVTQQNVAYSMVSHYPSSSELAKALSFFLLSSIGIKVLHFVYYNTFHPAISM